MSHRVHNPLAGRIAAFAAALLAALVIAVLPAEAANAHDELLGSSPAPDASVETLPAELTLTFSGAIAPDEGASEVAVTDASGSSLVDGAPTAQDNVLTQPLAGEASGLVTVLWKVVSSDGHPISGEFSFTVEGAPTPTATATPTPTATESTPTPTASASVSPAPPADTTSSALPWVIGGIVILVVAAGVTYLIVSRSRRERALAENRERALGGAAGPGSQPPAEH